MKAIQAIGATTAILFFGFVSTASARQGKPEHQEEQAKPEKQQHEQAKPQQHSQQNAKGKEKQQPEQNQQPQQRAKANKQQPQHTQQQAKSHQEQPKQQAQRQDSPAKQVQQQKSNGSHDQQARSSHGPQRSQQAMAAQRSQPALHLSSRGSGRIPDDRFRSNFGRGHNFRMGSPVLVGGYSRFQYGGYWFGFAQPWPVDWYYTDDVYIDYVDGGYYMYNPYYPGTRFELSVVI